MEFEIRDGVLMGCTGSGREAVIPEGVTAIAERAFEEKKEIVRAVFPKSLRVIGDGAFMHCGLEEIVIPPNVETVGKSAFEGCTSCRSVKIEAPLEEIAPNAFRAGYSVQELVLPPTLRIIGCGAFGVMKILEEIVLPKGVECISAEAFCDSIRLKKAFFPSTIRKIENRAFVRSGYLARKLLFYYDGSTENWHKIEKDPHYIFPVPPTEVVVRCRDGETGAW